MALVSICEVKQKTKIEEYTTLFSTLMFTKNSPRNEQTKGSSSILTSPKPLLSKPTPFDCATGKDIFTVKTFTEKELIGQTVAMCSFSKDFPLDLFSVCDEFGKVISGSSENGKLLCYKKIATTQGQSGSPVFLISENETGRNIKLIGIHSGRESLELFGFATFFTEEICIWIREVLQKEKLCFKHEPEQKMVESGEEFLFQEQWEGYHQNAQLLERWADKFFFDSFDFLGNENVLDIGSGDGKITSKIAKSVPNGKVIGIDSSQLMLSYAKPHEVLYKNLNFLLQAAQDEEFYQQHKNIFDLVVSFTVLHWVDDQMSVLKGIRECLKPNGKFFLRLSSKGGDPIQELADKLTQTEKYSGYFMGFKDPMHRFSVEEYSQLLKDANLKEILIQEIHDRDIIKGRDNLAKQVKSWLPHYHFLEKKSKLDAATFLDEIIDQYVTGNTNPEGDIVLHDHFLEVTGTKL